MSAKPKAIFVFELDGFQESILEHLTEQTNYILLVGSMPKKVTIPAERLVCLEQFVGRGELRVRAKQEAVERCRTLAPYYQNCLKELPQSHLMPAEFLAKLLEGLQSGVEDVLFHGFLLEAALQSFDIRCVATNLSGLASRQGIIAVAKQNSIPTLHLEHGVWISSQLQRPEPADVVALADIFSKEQVDFESEGKVAAVVTGLPIYQNIVTLSVEEDEQRKAEARLTLGLASDKLTILYPNTWVEGMYVGSACYVHKLVDTFEQVLNTLNRLERSGLPVQLVCRPHPSIRPYEDELAYREIAARTGYRDLFFIDDRKSECLAAADLVLCPTTNTSFLLDAFAEKRPVVALNTFPEVLNEFPKTVTSPLIQIAMTDNQLYNALYSLLTDKRMYAEQQERAYAYVSAVREFSGEEAKNNVCQLIILLAEKGLTSAADFENWKSRDGGLSGAQ